MTPIEKRRAAAMKTARVRKRMAEVRGQDIEPPTDNRAVSRETMKIPPRDHRGRRLRPHIRM